MKTGIIGDRQLLAEYELQISGDKRLQFTGTASGSDDFALQHEIVGKSELIVTDDIGTMKPELLKEAVKQGKHIFSVRTPDFSLSECNDLQKLAGESGAIIQFGNKLLEEPFSQWIISNWEQPVYMNYFESFEEMDNRRPIILERLMFAHKIFKTSPQRIRVNGINHSKTLFSFLNVRLDFPNISVFNFEIISHYTPGFSLRIISKNNMLEISADGRAFLNQKPVTLPPVEKNGLSVFIDSIEHKNSRDGLDLAALCSAISTGEEIEKKMRLYCL